MSNSIPNNRHCSILGTKISVTDMASATSYLTGALEELRGQYVCVGNVHTTVMSYRDREYRHIQNNAAMVLPDGKPLSIVSRQRGFREAERVAGPDLMPQIFRLSEEAGCRHYFLGSTTETLEKLREKILSAWPQLVFAGMYSPPFRPLTEEEDAAIVARINAAHPDFVWVAFGAPKQEKWMYEHRGQVTGVMIGVGAAFDFIAGTVRRAPRWMQKLCLEWLWRLMKDPVRLLPRYLSTNLTFMWRTAEETRAFRKQNRSKR
jgi:exopolysaccharide biosynthesis WecB/TagA/CpsF family protein